ncbi:MAG: formylmethanofuran dehydrogenase subunit B, partial [Candidatus Thorarchaeota archaeon]
MTEDSGMKENIVCPFCGCLCDDIVITVEGNKITDNKNGCSISQAKFMNHHDDRLVMDAPLEELVKKAAEIIVNSKRLLVYGLSSTENDAHREAYKIAEEVGGVVDNTSSVCHGPTILGSQESGESIAALAEARHRADLIIYWGSNPQFAHPRHMSRYTRADGMYIKDG